MKNETSSIVWAVVVTLVVAGFVGFTIGKAYTPRTPANIQGEITDKQIVLKQDMRKLWSDHVIWTRDYIIAELDSKPDAQAAADRLMKNQEEIGAALAAYYGDEAGNTVTTLLKEHIAIAVDLVADVKSGNTTKFVEDTAKWMQNGQEIADALSSLNPNWSKAMASEMMQTHLVTTAAELEARAAKQWEADVKAFDLVYAHMLAMSDFLANGIIVQFPEKF